MIWKAFRPQGQLSDPWGRPGTVGVGLGIGSINITGNIDKAMNKSVSRRRRKIFQAVLSPLFTKYLKTLSVSFCCFEPNNL